MTLSALGLVVSIFSGLLLVELFWPRSRGGLRDAWLKLSVAAGLGPGFSGALAFFVALVVGFRRGAIIAADVIALAVLVWLVVRSRRRASRRVGAAANLPTSPETRPAWVAVLVVPLVLVLIAAAGGFVILARQMPEGAWDAWAFWNLRAKHLVELPGGEWGRVFEAKPGFTGWKPGYPPLFPFLIARTWVWSGVESPLVPLIVAALFMFSLVGVLVSALWQVASRATALLAGMALLGTPILSEQGTWCYADVPLAWFILGTVALLVLAEARGEEGRGLLTLAGISAGFASLVKNEGILFLVIAVLTWFLAVWIRARRKEAGYTGTGGKRVGKKGARRIRAAQARGWFSSEIRAFAFGVALPAMLLAWFKLFVTRGVDAVGPEFAGALPVTSFDKHLDILRTLGRTIFCTMSWPAFPWGLAVAMPLLGVRVNRRVKVSTLVGLIVLGLMLIGYYAVYAFTNFEIHWLLSTTAYRLWVQILPLAIFVTFLVVRPPDEPRCAPAK